MPDVSNAAFKRVRRHRGGHDGGGGGGHDGGGSLRWLLTYADMITLLLAFFIIMYAISDSNSKKFQLFVSAVQNGFSIFGLGGGKKPGQSPSNPSSSVSALFDGTGKPLDGKVDPQPTQAPSPGTGSSESERPVSGLTRMQAWQQQVAQKMLDQVRHQGLGELAWLESTDRDVRLIILDTALFDSRYTRLTTKGCKVLSEAARDLRDAQTMVRVEGHTTASPPNEASFATNWELSCLKAVLVTRFLADKAACPPERLQAVGHSQYSPLRSASGNDDPRNARIEIVLPIE